MRTSQHCLTALFRMLIGAVLTVLVVETADAQSSGPPTFSVGDTWKRSNGLVITVIKADEDRTAMTGFLSTCPTCVYHLDKNLTILGVTTAEGQPLELRQHAFVPVGPGWKFYDFPLEVKKSWRVSGQGFFKGTPQNYTADCSVEAYEDVKTKAGTFKAYKIWQRWTVHTTFRPFDWSNTVWYAPEVKSLVKVTSNNPNTQEWELLEYSVK